MEPSKFHFFSFGIVAANKKHGSDMVEIFPQEKFTMSSGEITDNVEAITTKGKDASGQDYEDKTETKPSLTCKWLPIGEPNRITAPDVRRNEQVIIYRYADTSYYFWTNAFNNVLRKLETVAWWYSGTPEDGASADTVRDMDNGYVCEVSTHSKHVIFSTSKKNGEVARYYVQFDGGEGNFTVQDDMGQMVEFDSVGGKINVTAEDEINATTKKYTVNCEQHIVNCKTSVVNASESVKHNTPITDLSGKLKVAGTSLLIGYTNITGGIGGGGEGSTSSPLDFKANVRQQGTWVSEGAITMNSTLTVAGKATFAVAITAPNVN